MSAALFGGAALLVGIAGVGIQLVWAALARRRRRGVWEKLEALALQSLGAEGLDAACSRLTEVTTQLLAPRELVVFRARGDRWDEWSSGTRRPAPAALESAFEAVAGHDDTFETRSAPFDLLVPLGGDVVLGMRCAVREADPQLWEHWRLAARTAIQTVALREAHDRSLVAGELEHALAMGESLAGSREGQTGWLDWAVSTPAGGEGERCFWSGYPLDDDRVFFVLGHLPFTGVSASLLRVSIKSYCDTLVRLLGARVEGGTVLAMLNRFLWRPTDPIGMSCQVITCDRRGPGRATIATAGACAVGLAGSGGLTQKRLTSPPLGVTLALDPEGTELAWGPDQTLMVTGAAGLVESAVPRDVAGIPVARLRDRDLPRIADGAFAWVARRREDIA